MFSLFGSLAFATTLKDSGPVTCTDKPPMADSRRSEATARPSEDDFEKLAPRAETGPLETDLPRPEGVDDATWERFREHVANCPPWRTPPGVARCYHS